MKKEHEDMAAADETALKWAKADYVREQVERQHRAYEEIKARRRGRDKGGIIVQPPRTSVTLVRGAARTAAATTPGSTGSSACRRQATAAA